MTVAKPLEAALDPFGANTVGSVKRISLTAIIDSDSYKYQL